MNGHFRIFGLYERQPSKRCLYALHLHEPICFSSEDACLSFCLTLPFTDIPLPSLGCLLG